MIRIYGRVVEESDAGISFDPAATIDGGTRERVFFARGSARRAGTRSGWDVLAVTREALLQLRQGYRHVHCDQIHG